MNSSQHTSYRSHLLKQNYSKMNFQKFYFMAIAIFLVTSPFQGNGTPLLRYGRPEERGSLFEGDIVGEGGRAGNPGTMSSGLKSNLFRWPNNTVIYEFSSTFPEDFRVTFLEATLEISQRTCKERTTEMDYVHVIQDGNNCYSYVGRTGGRQDLSLGPGCYNLGTHLHEIIHAIGFHHEQSRPDRNKHIRILWKNIDQSHYTQFQTKRRIVSTFNLPYDMDSIMHYSSFAFSKNAKVTLTARNSTVEFREKEEMSPLDIKKINLMYNCPETLSTTEASSV